jgi:hypothetical protein
MQAGRQSSGHGVYSSCELHDAKHDFSLDCVQSLGSIKETWRQATYYIHQEQGILSKATVADTSIHTTILHITTWTNLAIGDQTLHTFDPVWPAELTLNWN